MKSFKQVTEATNQAAMKKYITREVMDTEKPHDEIKQAFIKKFGKQNGKMFDKIVSELVD